MAKENTAEPNPFTHSVVLRVPGAEAVDVIRDQPWGFVARLVSFPVEHEPETKIG